MEGILAGQVVAVLPHKLCHEAIIALLLVTATLKLQDDPQYRK